MAITDFNFRLEFVINNPETSPYVPMSGSFGLLKIRDANPCVEISMSVLISLTSWCSLVTVSSSKQSLDLRRLNES